MISRPKICRLLLGAMEGIVLAMVCLSPWAYGAVHPGFEFILDAGVSLLVVLWGLRILVEGQLFWTKCPVALCLVCLVLIGICQIIPLNKTLLAALDPAAANLYEQLLPSQPEELPFGAQNTKPAAGATISLYPHATRLHMQKLVVIFLVFAVVRNNLGSTGALRRLGIAALLNGASLALFALVQFFSSPPHVLYWTYPSAGRVFGPFICRNHFPFYVNMCIGLGLGVLWSRRSGYLGVSPPRTEVNAPHLPRDPGLNRAHPYRWRDRINDSLGMLHDPISLGICSALALMVSSVVFSLSRGGFLALVGGFGVCVVVKMARSPRSPGIGTLFLILGLAVGLLGWFGLTQIQARWTSAVEGTALQESRLPLWSSALTMVKDFPLWGTGYGTYQYLDPLYRTNTEFADVNVDHVHNEYLEMLVEGGLLGLLLSLLTIGQIFRLGYQAVNTGYRTGALALGALFAFSTVVFHSFGDFGIHIPAIALLTTVLCAQLCALGCPDGVRLPSQTDQGLATNLQYTFRWGGLAPVFGAVLSVLFGLIVLGAGWRLYRVQNLAVGAFRAGQKAEPGSLELKKDYLEAAVRVDPEDAELRTELGEVYGDLFRTHHETLLRQNRGFRSAETATILSSTMVSGLMPPMLVFLPLEVIVAAARWDLASANPQHNQRTYLLPALRNYLQARDLGPILPGPHLGLALHAGLMTNADSPEVYRSRVKILAPCDPAFWYSCGSLELRHGYVKHAWKSWRRCLELTDRYQRLILEASCNHLEPEGLVRELIPDQPEQLLSVALSLYPRPDAIGKRSPFLQKALVLLGDEPTTLKDLHIKAKVHKALNEPAKAVALYQALLARDALQPGWRYELAQVLYSAGRLQEARLELLTVMAHQPKHPQAYDLFTTVTKELLRKQLGRN